MKQSVFIIIFGTLFVLLEFSLFNILGKWGIANLCLILIIFMNLWMGIRYSLLAAAFTGFLKDAFSVSVFGTYFFSFLLCAYIVTILKEYIYKKGSDVSRVTLVLVMTFIYVFIEMTIRLMFTDLSIGQAFKHIFIPEMFLTGLVAIFIINKLRQCALKYFV